MNFRIMVILAVSLMLGIALATYLFVSEQMKFFMFFVLFFVFILFLAVACSSKIKIFFVFAVISLTLSLPFLSLYIKSKEYNKNEMFDGQEVIVYGKIDDNYSESESSLKFILSDLTIIYESKTYEIDGKMVIYTSPSYLNLDDLEIGRYVSVTATPSFVYLDSSDSISYYLSSSVVASCYVPYYYITFTDDYSLSLRDKIQSSVQSYFENLDSDYANLGFTMMFGSTAIIGEDLVTIFRSTGIAHLLAVSGLHVGLLAMILSFVFKKLKIPKTLNFVLMGTILGFYAYLCNFSVSVVRASLMFMFHLYAGLRNREYDRLSVLSMVAVLILLFCPLKMFSVSFILSFSAVLMIILICPPLERFFNKFFYQKLASILALNFSIQFGLIVIYAVYFNKINILSFICNLISVPVIIFCFVALMICICLSFILPFMSFVTSAFDYLVGIIVKLNYFISNLNTTIVINNFSMFDDIILKIMFFISSDYTFFPKRQKVAACLSVATASFLVYVI